MVKKIVLPGGSGFLGESLANFLVNKGYEVVILSRGNSKNREGIKYVQWDGKTLGDWKEELENSEAIVNFTGKSVNCIYNEKNKREIISSRVDSVEVLHTAIKQVKNPPKVFVQAGSLAIFGDTTDLCDENAPFGNGFSEEVCKKWEEVFYREELPNIKKVFLRIGFVLGRNGGALEPLEKLTRLNLGGTVGSGKQYISWLHIDDLNEMIREGITNDNIQGTYNATGPNPVTNKEFMKTLRTVLGKGWAPSTPAFCVKIGAYLVMRTEPNLALTGRNCIPKKLLEEGFVFKYTNLEETLKNLYS